MNRKEKDDAINFGRMLKQYREESQITQLEIAKAAGLSKNYISAIERGVHKCNAQTFIVYAKKCNASLDVMAGLTINHNIDVRLVRKIERLSLTEQAKLAQILDIITKQ